LDAAKSAAHQIGRYVLGLGDFVQSYVTVIDARAIKGGK
jgi:hypothetical protein